MSNKADQPSNALVVRQTQYAKADASIDYRAIVELADIGITKTETGTGRIYFANAAFCRMIGYSAQELSDGSISFLEMTHPDDRARNVSLHQQFLRGQLARYTIEKRYVRKDGSIFWGRTSVKHLPRRGSGPGRTLALIEDISREVAEGDRPRSASGTLDPGLAATDPDAVQRARLRPAEDFIRLNWNKPQRIDLLAELCGISSRVLFRDFERVHSCSPAAYAKRVRLARVREMLLKGEASVTVMAVAFSGGFSNLGHFSRDYRILFGELPSATLKRARLAGRSAEA